MAERNIKSVQQGRTNQVRPLPRLARPVPARIAVDAPSKVVENELPVASHTQTTQGDKSRNFTDVTPVLTTATFTRPVNSESVSSYNRLKRNIPLDRLVDGISARSVPAHPQKHLTPIVTPPEDNDSLAQTQGNTLHQEKILRESNPERRATGRTPASTKSTSRFTRFIQTACYGLAGMVMIFFGWLAYDTLQTNKGIEQITGGSSSQVQALAERYDETVPKGDPLKNYVVAPDLPRAIYIDKLGVQAKVIRVGVTDTNAMAVPKSIYEAGWYDGSVKPGETGAVVVNGHVSGPTRDGVFHDLKQLKSGDNLVLEKGDKTKLTYKVRRVQELAVKDVDMTKLLVAEPGVKSLHLITCGGLFDQEVLQFQSRVIVYADQI
jgi:LPXTG-site transpeptidase (sortase) family protein